MAGAIAAKEIAPLAAEVDREGAHFENGKVTYAKGTARAMDILAKSNLLGFTLPRRYQGLNFPGLLYSMAIEMVSQADASLMNLFGLQDIAETIHEFGDDALKDRYLPQFATGKVTGAMILTEPDAGSDLQSVRLKAVPAGGRLLEAVRREALHHQRLRRREPGAGAVGGRQHRRPRPVHVRVRKGAGAGDPPHRAQARNPRLADLRVAVQRRAGAAGRAAAAGLIRYVMSLMNGARVGVACQGIGIAQAAYEEALKYARKRVQFKHPIIDFPAVYDMLARMKSRIQVARAITYEASRLAAGVREAAGDISLRARLKEVLPAPPCSRRSPRPTLPRWRSR